MNDVDRYIDAATRDNTRRSYRAAIEHFEVTAFFKVVVASTV
ncbi:hypothetical protein RYA95_15045 [Pseudomonas syringae pv. actinidiae]|nr:hypothetical protein [Pseudomonas syringae]MDU8614428.1 hypothetical protein [Pseudomonas syringae pv. actinidiae]OSN81980.1 hypothetical protein BV352_03399 [Pseudomonas syringae pv. actinidiae]